MKVPKEVQIGKTNYRVHNKTGFGSSPVVGRIDYALRTITLASHGGVTKKKRTPAQLQDTLWHEITHGILKDMKNPLESDEKFVCAISSRIAKVVRQLEAP